MAAGTSKGCDWSTRFGKTGLDLNGITAAAAKDAAGEAASTEEMEDWNAASSWLEWLESLAEQAEVHAVHAVEAAKENEWPRAMSHARWARALEFSCGRVVRRDGRLMWGPFCKTVEEAAGVQRRAVLCRRWEVSGIAQTQGRANHVTNSHNLARDNRQSALPNPPLIPSRIIARIDVPRRLAVRRISSAVNSLGPFLARSMRTTLRDGRLNACP